MAENRNVSVLVKVVPTVVEIDQLTGVPSIDTNLLGISAADRAAVAVGRELARVANCEVTIYCVTARAGTAALMDIAATGPGKVVRIALSGDEELSPDRWLRSYSSSLVASVLASYAAGSRFIVTGDHSLDRGSGTVPARVAQRLGYSQALGLLEVDATAQTAVRRLDSGWREHLSFDVGTVLSVEANAGRLDRASPTAMRTAAVSVLSDDHSLEHDDGIFVAYRAPVDVVTPPSETFAARRAMEVIGALTAPKVREVVTAEPADAARTILERLSAWGYQ